MRRDFPARIEDEALARAAGQCEVCGGQLKPGKFQFDHKKSYGLGGDNTLENCVVTCTVCHLQKTLDSDMPKMREADRKAKVKSRLPVASGESEIARRFK